MSIGIAKPMPTLPLPLPPVSIWELMPMTRPAASRSGPPELPGLIAASVWMTPSISKPFGAWIVRFVADTTPVVSVRSRPKGLPIAIVGSPTCTPRELPSASGSSSLGLAVTLRTARSVDSSRPRIVAVDDVAVGELDGHLRRAGDDVGVREDRALAVDDEARAGRLAALLLGEAEVERRLRLLDDLRADEDDARRGALVDVARGEAGAAAVRAVLAAQRRLLDDRRRVPAAEVERRDDADREHAADDGRDERDRDQRLPPHCAQVLDRSLNRG